MLNRCILQVFIPYYWIWSIIRKIEKATTRTSKSASLERERKPRLKVSFKYNGEKTTCEL
jgi:hypothetical protein